MDTETLRARAKAARAAKLAHPIGPEPTALIRVGVRRLYVRGTKLADIPPVVRGIPWAMYQALYLNSIFLSFGTMKEPARITPETVAKGEKKWKR